MAATLDAGPSASLAMEKRHTGCAQNFSRTSGVWSLSIISLGISGPAGGTTAPAHRAAWTATSPFLNGSEQMPHVVTSSCSAILAASDFDVSLLDLPIPHTTHCVDWAVCPREGSKGLKGASLVSLSSLSPVGIQLRHARSLSDTSALRASSASTRCSASASLPRRFRD